MFKRKDTQLIVESWKKFIKEGSEEELSQMDLRYIEMYKREYKHLSEDIIKKIYVATQNQQDILNYSLGYTNEDSWGDNLQSYLNEKLGINLEAELKEDVFNRHFLSMLHEYKEMCKKYINKKHSISSAIEEFLYELLNKLYSM